MKRKGTSIAFLVLICLVIISVYVKFGGGNFHESYPVEYKGENEHGKIELIIKEKSYSIKYFPSENIKNDYDYADGYIFNIYDSYGKKKANFSLNIFKDKVTESIETLVSAKLKAQNLEYFEIIPNDGGIYKIPIEKTGK